MAWLRYGDAWQHLIFRGLEDYYWRPLVWALFVAEVRAFDVASGPMHLVSIGVHLANTWIVGMIALRWARITSNTSALRVSARQHAVLRPAPRANRTGIVDRLPVRTGRHFFHDARLVAQSLPATRIYTHRCGINLLFPGRLQQGIGRLFPLLILLVDWMSIRTSRQWPGNVEKACRIAVTRLPRRVHCRPRVHCSAFWALGFLCSLTAFDLCPRCKGSRKSVSSI